MSVLAVVFGRDEVEDGAEPAFSFTESHVKGLLECAMELLRCDSWGFVFVLTPQTSDALLSMVISDSHKVQLLRHQVFIPCLLEGLLLNPGSPHTDEAVKAAVAENFVQCFQQLACFPQGCDALRAEPKVQAALTLVVAEALSQRSKDCADATLKLLWPPVATLQPAG